MTEILEYSECPVCGENKWFVVERYTNEPRFCCYFCGTLIPADGMNRRVLRFVPCSERLPEKSGYYHVMAETHIAYAPYFDAEEKKWIGCPWEIIEWLEDRRQK